MKVLLGPCLHAFTMSPPPCLNCHFFFSIFVEPLACFPSPPFSPLAPPPSLPSPPFLSLHQRFSRLCQVLKCWFVKSQLLSCGTKRCHIVQLLLTKTPLWVLWTLCVYAVFGIWLVKERLGRRRNDRNYLSDQN